jgi:hypothetical protein
MVSRFKKLFLGTTADHVGTFAIPSVADIAAFKSADNESIKWLSRLAIQINL